MEYVAGGNLHQLVNRQGGLSEKLARWFFQQLIVALDYCHKVSHSNDLSSSYALSAR